MAIEEAYSENIHDGIVHPSQGFWFLLANQKIPEELLKKRRVTLKLRKLTGKYGLAIATSSLVTFAFLSFIFGRVLGIL